jgi:hypothetical protein
MVMKDIDTWASDTIKTVTITQDVGDLCYEVGVREYIPYPEDPLARIWKSNGVQMRHPCTPYAIADMQEAATILKSFAEDNVEQFMDYYIDKTDDLLSLTYNMVLKHANNTRVCHRTKFEEVSANSQLSNQKSGMC